MNRFVILGHVILSLLLAWVALWYFRFSHPLVEAAVCMIAYWLGVFHGRRARQR